jgi:hypothetical protein
MFGFFVCAVALKTKNIETSNESRMSRRPMSRSFFKTLFQIRDAACYREILMPTRLSLRWVLILFVIVLGQRAGAEPKTILDTDFGKADQPIQAGETADQKISGSLPAPWADDSTFQKEADVRYEPVKDPEKNFLRVHRASSGKFQMKASLDDSATEETFYRLSIETRSFARSPIFVQVYQPGKPRKQLFSRQFDASEIWNESTATFRLPPHNAPIDLLVWGWGDESDFGKMSIVRETTSDLIARLKKEHPDGGEARNLLRVSRFPLGLQSGSAIDRDHSDEVMEVAADEKVVGPSGAPALKLHSASPMFTELSPFDIPWTFHPHVLSLQARGTGMLRIMMRSGDREVAAINATLKPDQWTRQVLPFQPTLLGAIHQVAFYTSGDVWIDALQVEPGKKASPYQSRPEVALSWPKSEVSAARIQFEDEPPVLDYAVTGAPKDASLVTRVIDLYGDESEAHRFPATDTRGQIRYDVFPKRPLGQFRIEAWIEDGNGKHISPPNEAIVTRLRRPHYWGKDAPDSHFGVHMNCTTRHLRMTKAIGINWTRLHDAGGGYIQWSFLEPVKGQWTFYDDAINKYRSEHISIFGSISTAPCWATSVGGETRGYWERFVQPEDWDAWQNYVTTVVKRYRGTIDYWDTWNEPWGKFWSKWDPTANTQQPRSPDAGKDFAKLQKLGYEAAKAVDPNVHIAGINTYSNGAKWTRDVVEHGGATTCDIYDYHHYNSEFTGFPGDAVERGYHTALDPIGKIDKPVWMTEGNGANRMLKRGFYHFTLPDTIPPEDFVRTSDMTARYMVRLLSMNVAKIFLYHINVGGAFSDGPQAFQSLVTDDGYVHPQAAAHSQLAYELEDAKFDKHLDLGGGIHAYLFKSPERAVAVILSNITYRKDYTLPHPKDGSVRDLFGNDLPPDSKFTGTTVYISVKSIADLEQLFK